MPFSSYTNGTADRVAFLRWLLTLSSCLTDESKAIQLKFRQENILKSIYEYKIDNLFAFSFTFKCPLAILVRKG